MIEFAFAVLTMDMKPPPWFAVRVKPRTEARVGRQLAERGYQTFLASQKVSRRWSDRTKVLDESLFPGYLFCRFDPHAGRLGILSVSGVISILGFAGQLAPIADTEIESVRAMLQSESTISAWPYIRSGDAVRVDAGPMAGLQGIMVRTSSGVRVVVSVTMLQRSVAAEVDRSWLTPLANV